MTISFKATRDIGLLVLTVVIITLGFFSFLTAWRIENSLSAVIRVEWPALESVVNMRQVFLDARDIFRDFSETGEGDIQPAVAGINEAVREAEKLKKLLPAEEKRTQEFIAAARRFRIAIVTYAEEARTDITGARAIEMEKIARAAAGNAEMISASLMGDVRAMIATAEGKAAGMADNSQRANLLGIALGIGAGLLAALFMGWGLRDPISKLVEGTQRIARGDLLFRVKVESHDEIGQLSAAFNKMADDLSAAIRKEKDLAVAAEAAADSEKKKSLALSAEVAERMQVEEELEQSIAELSSTQQMLIQSEKLASLGRLVSEIAHEVNNPLMIISGNAQLALMSEPVSGEIKENLETIADECQRAKVIIQRLLKFSRPSKGEIKKVDINKSIEAVTGILEHQFRLAGVEIKKEYQEDLPPVSIDELQIQEVMMNLINNAKEAMADGGGTITITSSLEKEYVRIDLKDSGSGMSEETMRMVFEPFFTTKEKGTGLGLSICYGIINAHKGKLELKSELNKGTTVTVRLPRESKA